MPKQRAFAGNSLQPTTLAPEETPMTEEPRVAVLAIGGTIAMVKGDEGGVRPRPTVEDLVAAALGDNALE